MLILAKPHILKRFNAAAATYDAVADIQQQAALQLVHKIREQWPECKPNKVLDLGAGTGFLSELLSNHFPDANLLLNDASSAMLAAAKTRFLSHYRVHFCEGFLEEMSLGDQDLVVSNLALQWVDQFDNTVQQFYNQSRYFAFTTLLAGSFAQWDQRLCSVGAFTPNRKYRSEQELHDLVQQLNPLSAHVSFQTWTKTVENAHAAMRYFKHLGASWRGAPTQLRALRRLMRSDDAPIQLTYHVGFVLLYRGD